MNKSKLATFMAVAALAAAGMAWAQADISEEERFLMTDFDGDGCISWEELRNRGNIVFAALDLNGDGIIAGDEHPTAVNAKGETVRPEAVDVARFTVALRIAFDRSDDDEDGCIDKREWH